MSVSKRSGAACTHAGRGSAFSARTPDVKSRAEPRIAVIGAGPVGATLALALSRAAIPSILIEQRPAPSPGHRPVALSYASRQILDALGAWSAIEPMTSPIARVHVSQRGCFGATRLSAGEFGLDALGYVSTVSTLVGALDRMLAESSGVLRLSSTAVTGIDRATQGIRLRLAGAAAESGTRCLDVSAVVAADGGRSSWCTEYVETVELRKYGQVALGALVRGEVDHRCIAYERFTSEGPIAMLPMPDGNCALVWTLTPERGRALRYASEAAFLNELHRAFGDRLGRFVEVRNRETVPLCRARGRAPPNSRIYLAGAAANTVHPVAGQGLNLGLRDAATLAEVVADAMRSGLDPGSAECLERYQALRRRDHGKVGLATDLLARAFLPGFGPLTFLRGTVLVGLDLLNPVKREFARQAMGLGLPAGRLVRGLAP